MTIPKSVNIGGHRFKVVYPYKLRSKEAFYGRISYDKKEIHITKGEPRVAFWHEILHGIDRVYNSEGLSEPTIRRLAQGLYQVTKEMV